MELNRRLSYDWPFSQYNFKKLTSMKVNVPQNGIPAGVHVPLDVQRRRDGPNSSKPSSQWYVAIVSTSTSFEENVTVACAGEPG